MTTHLAGVLQSMPDLTQIVISSGFILSIAIALIGFLWLRKRSPIADEGEPPPPMASWGKVAIDIYRPLDFAGVALIWMIFFRLIVLGWKASSSEALVLTVDSLLTSMIMQVMLAGIAIVWISPRMGLSDWLGLRWKNWKWIMLIAPACVVAMMLCMGLLYVSGVTPWIQSLGVDPVQDTVKLLQETEDVRLLGMMGFLAVIVAPICEEIVFRGFIYPVAKSACGWPVAMLCSGLFFACAHSSVITLLPLWIFGCLLAWLYEKSGSIWAPIATHACLNATTVVVQLAARYFNIPIDPP